MATRNYGTGSIRQRSANGYSIRYYGLPGSDGKRTRVEETVKGTKKVAERLLRDRLAALDTGDFINKQKATVKQFLDQWLDVYGSTNLAEKTQQGYRQLVDCYTRDFANRPIQSLTGEHIQAVYSKMTKRGLTATTVVALHRVLHKALKTGVQWGVLKRNVADATTPPKIKKKEMKMWDLESRTWFFKSIKEHKYSDFLTFGILTGARRGEIAGLTWENVDLNDNRISVVKNLGRITGKGLVSRNPKTSRSRRSLALSPATVNLLHEVRGKQIAQQSMIGEAWHSTGYVFTQPDGRPIDPDLVTKAFNKMVKETGVPHLTPHGLRHAYATAALEASIDPKVVSQHLGHASVSTTYDIYAHVIPELETESAKKIEAKLLGK